MERKPRLQRKRIQCCFRVKTCVLPPYLSSHSPRCQHVAAEVELAGLHLVIAGAAVVGNGLDVSSTLEHLDVVHDGLVARSYHRLVLADVERRKQKQAEEGESGEVGMEVLSHTHARTHTRSPSQAPTHSNSIFSIFVDIITMTMWFLDMFSGSV